MNETKLWLKFRKEWLIQYPRSFIQKISQRFSSGFPDCICINGKVNFVELKVGSNKPTELQCKTLDDIRRSGGRAYVLVYDKEYKLYDCTGFMLQSDDLKRIVKFIDKGDFEYADSHINFKLPADSDSCFMFIFHSRFSRKARGNGEKHSAGNKRREI